MLPHVTLQLRLYLAHESSAQGRLSQMTQFKGTLGFANSETRHIITIHPTFLVPFALNLFPAMTHDQDAKFRITQADVARLQPIENVRPIGGTSPVRSSSCGHNFIAMRCHG